MKSLLLVAIIVASTFIGSAQTTAGRTGQRKARVQPKQPATQLRGSGQYHGSKDTTPGSPMGTGGAGGNEMSGSPAGSASEAAIKAAKEQATPSGQGVNQDSRSRNVNSKKNGRHKVKRM